jgi:hypothetical protein
MKSALAWLSPSPPRAHAPSAPPSKLILQTRVHPLHHRPLLVAFLFRPTQLPVGVLGRYETLGSLVMFHRINHRRVPLLAAVIQNVAGIVGTVDKVVTVCHPLRGYGHQWNGDLRIMQLGCRQHRAEGDLTIGHVQV